MTAVIGLPGYYVAVWFMDSMGRRNMQLQVQPAATRHPPCRLVVRLASRTSTPAMDAFHARLRVRCSHGYSVALLQGFVLLTILFSVLGVGHSELTDLPMLMLLLYGLTFFFSNFGPNSTTFILPAETFPSSVRSTLNGFCAAMGKLGATVGSAVFKPLIKSTGLGGTMVGCALVSLAGLLVTWFYVEDLRGVDIDAEAQEVNEGQPLTEAEDIDASQEQS